MLMKLNSKKHYNLNLHGSDAKGLVLYLVILSRGVAFEKSLNQSTEGPEKLRRQGQAQSRQVLGLRTVEALCYPGPSCSTLSVPCSIPAFSHALGFTYRPMNNSTKCFQGDTWRAPTETRLPPFFSLFFSGIFSQQWQAHSHFLN